MKKILSIMLCVSMIVALLGGCSPKTDGNNAAKKDTLSVAMSSEPSSLDPQGSSGIPDRRVVKQIYDTLVVQNADMEIEPCLATSWSYLDDTTIEFKLRENVKWHNGEPFTANDVLYSLRRAIESKYTTQYVSMIDIDNTKAVDNLTVQVKLKEPFGPILAHLSFAAISMVNEKAVTEGGENYGMNPVGTGPFKFTKWNKGDSIELVANEEYWGVKPEYKKLNMRVITETANRAIELETGNVEIAFDISANDIERIEKSQDCNIDSVPNFAITFLGFNCDKEPMNNPKVRQAIAYAVNKKDIVDATFLGTGAEGTGPIPSTVWGYTSDVTAYDYNVEKAKQLLQEAGYSNTNPLKLYVNDNRDRITIAEIVSNQLNKVGISVETKIVEQASYLPALENKEEDMYILSWTTVTGDADFGLYTQYTSSSFGKSGNRCYYSNPEVDEALITARTNSDEKVRLEAYKKAQQLISQDVPAIYIWQGESIFGVSKNIEGFVNMPSGIVGFNSVKFK